MISVDEAQKMVLDQVGSRSKLMLMMSLQCSAMMREESGVMVLATEMVDFRSSLGRVLCQEVTGNHRLVEFAKTTKQRSQPFLCSNNLQTKPQRTNSKVVMPTR